MKCKLINFSTSYKQVSNSGSYWDLIGLRELWLDVVTEGNDYDFIIFSLSNINIYGWLLSEHTINSLKELNECKKPVLCLFLDFRTRPRKLEKISTFRKKYNELLKYEFIDNKDNWYLLSYTQDIDKLKRFLRNKSNCLKIKEENIIYFNNMTFWYYWLLNVNNQYNWKICYIGNGRGWDRNEFLSRFEWFDIYGRWKDQQIKELKHNFLWVIKQTDVKLKMNQYFGHIITYDKIGIDYKVDVTRLVYTVASGCLPIIDSRLKYLWLPEQFNKLYVQNKEDVYNLLQMSIEEREQIINDLREYFTVILDKNKELQKIKDILSIKQSYA